MGFNPLKEKGTPLEKQYRPWSTLNVQPFDKAAVHPYTRTRVILMNGIEVEAAIFLHQLARHCPDAELKQKLAAVRRVEQQQQKMINWLNPGEQSVLETTIGYEQVAVDLTAWLARTEPDKHVKQALDFALLEDFDHLYRYANLLDMQGVKAEKLVGEYTEIFPGRPTVSEHRHPFDSVNQYADYSTADPLTKLHIGVIVAAEQQTMNFYMNAGATTLDPVARGLYQEIAMIEEQHVSHYETLADPRLSWWEMKLMHEYVECYMYYSCLQDETDKDVRRYWDMFLHDEITHLQMAAELYKKFENKDPAALIPEDMPELVKFQPNREYVRELLAETVDQTKDGPEYVQSEKLGKGHRYWEYQNTVNADGAPSQEVIEKHIAKHKQDYRWELQGEHPVSRFRARDKAVK